MAEEAPKVLVRHDDAEAFVVNLLVAVGVSAKHAQTIAHGLVQADCKKCS
jgi:LDH2 family malate/lactate/ureidoglycolate dehydrogenase